MKGNKGQFTIIGLIIVFITIVVLGALFPVITEYIELAKGCATSTTDTILDLIPFMLPVGVLITIVIYATAGREQRRY